MTQNFRQPPKPRWINVNTVLTTVVIGILFWIGRTAVDTRELVTEIRIHQHYNEQRLDRLEKQVGLQPMRELQ
jgi:cell division protein FtsB